MFSPISSFGNTAKRDAASQDIVSFRFNLDVEGQRWPEIATMTSQQAAMEICPHIFLSRNGNNDG
jgi:hypothetical protein